MPKKEYSLWLEFENYVGSPIEEPGNDFCNIQVSLPNGKEYAFNVWSFDFMKSQIDEAIESHIKPPDLFVKRLRRDCIENAIDSYLEFGTLPDHLEIIEENSDDFV